MLVVPEDNVYEVRQVKDEKHQLDREFFGKIKDQTSKGLTLYAMCNKTFEVYEVKKVVVESKTAKYDFSTGKVTNLPKYEYIIPRGHYTLWALNMNNACRKFNQLIDKYWK